MSNQSNQQLMVFRLADYKIDLYFTSPGFVFPMRWLFFFAFFVVFFPPQVLMPQIGQHNIFVTSRTAKLLLAAFIDWLVVLVDWLIDWLLDC